MPSHDQKKFATVMHEFKNGALRSGSGNKVTDRKQALAIAMNESAKMQGGK
jgi:hypothetical protein